MQPQSNGVGLSLTKKLVTLHKGDIQVESSIGEGSRFTVLIPIDRNYYPEIKDIIETSEIPSTVPNEATEDTEEKEDTILLVDDNEEFLLLMKRKLATHYNILTATEWEKKLGNCKKRRRRPDGQRLYDARNGWNRALCNNETGHQYQPYTGIDAYGKKFSGRPSEMFQCRSKRIPDETIRYENA